MAWLNPVSFSAHPGMVCPCPGTAGVHDGVCCAAGNGSFSINFWFKPSTTGNPGELFGYILSIAANATRTTLATTDTFAVNNIDIYLPQEGHPAWGLVRADLAAQLQQLPVSCTASSSALLRALCCL